MPAFIDPNATGTVDLPECYCPNTPHDHDTVTIRTQYGYGDLLDLASVHTEAGRIDPMAERAKLLQIGIREWSFVDDQGTPVPVSLGAILMLQQHIAEPIVRAIDEAYAASNPPLPNPSSGPSQPSSSARSTAFSNRATRRAARRSTSKSKS